MTRVPLALLLVLAASPAAAIPLPPLDAPRLTPPIAERPRLHLDRAGAAAVVAGALLASRVGAGASASGDLAACRWCEPNGFDRAARSALRWGDPDAASRASDALRAGVPLASAAAVAWLAGREGGGREMVEDVGAVVAAVWLASPINDAVKHGSGRLRPGAWAAGGPTGEGDLHSFFSSHVSRVAAASAAAAQVARLRGRSGWKWLAAAGVVASAGTAWLRIGADAHWATDVLVGGAAGAAVGLAVPPLMLRRGGERRRGRIASVAPAPGGVKIAF